MICVMEWDSALQSKSNLDQVQRKVILRALLTFEKYETTNYDISGMRRYCRNILQWNKSNLKSTKMTNGDYWLHIFQRGVIHNLHNTILVQILPSPPSVMPKWQFYLPYVAKRNAGVEPLPLIALHILWKPPLDFILWQELIIFYVFAT